jgi:hypothetical protein
MYRIQLLARFVDGLLHVRRQLVRHVDSVRVHDDDIP